MTGVAAFVGLFAASLLGFAACWRFVVEHPVCLVAPAVFVAFVTGVAIAERGTRRRIRRWCQTGAPRLGLWTCDEASWRWSIDQRRKSSALALVLLAALSTTIVTFAAAAASDDVTGALAIGAAWCGQVVGVGGFERARRVARQLRDPRREVTFCRSFVLLGDSVLQLNAEPQLPDVAAEVWLVACALTTGSTSWSGSVLRLSVLTLQRAAPRLDVVCLAAPASRAGDTAAVVASYREIAAANRGLPEVAAQLPRLSTAQLEQVMRDQP